MRHALAALTLAAFLAAAPAFAVSKEAQVRQRNGQKFFKDGNYVGALVEFQEALREDGGYELLFDIGQCEARLNHYSEAMEALDRYLREGGAAIPKRDFDAVMKERDAIRKKTAEVNVRVEGEPADVTLDGESLGKSPITRLLRLTAGPKVFRATREGFKPAEKTVEIVPGPALPVSVVLNPIELGKEPAVLEIDTDPAGAALFVDGKSVGTAPLTHEVVPGGHIVVAELEGHSPAEQEVRAIAGEKFPLSLKLEPVSTEVKRPLPLTGIIVGGSGAVALIGSFALFANAQANKEKINALFRTGGTWDATYAELEAGGKRASAFSAVLGIAGGAALATGLTLIALQMFVLPAQPKKLSTDTPAEGETPAETPAEQPAETPAPESSLLLTPVPGGVYAASSLGRG